MTRWWFEIAMVWVTRLALVAFVYCAAAGLWAQFAWFSGFGDIVLMVGFYLTMKITQPSFRFLPARKGRRANVTFS